MNDTSTNHADDYLQVMPRFEADPRSQRWHVYRVSDESPRITLAGSVSSCEEAQALAARDKRPLRIAEQPGSRCAPPASRPRLCPTT